ncbi:MAG: hypothetical protein FJ276_35285 [Planctomycetes bacterium]|nr:hypothetical protein [Planctomycetota bacterium]
MLRHAHRLCHREIWHDASPGAKGGGNNAKGGDTPAFAEDPAARTCKHKRTVRRVATLDAAFPEESLDSIAGTPGANRKSELKKLAEPELQHTVAETSPHWLR